MLIAAESGGSGTSSLLFFVVLLVGMYLLLIRPQRARAKQLAAVQSAVGVGSRVITTAGLHATVADADGDTVVLEIAPGVRATFERSVVVRVLDPVGDDDAPGPTDPA
ncbi:MAG: preprotein translocase subunit YajC [Actinomycetes bacterium]